MSVWKAGVWRTGVWQQSSWRGCLVVALKGLRHNVAAKMPAYLRMFNPFSRIT